MQLQIVDLASVGLLTKALRKGGVLEPRRTQESAQAAAPRMRRADGAAGTFKTPPSDTQAYRLLSGALLAPMVQAVGQRMGFIIE